MWTNRLVYKSPSPLIVKSPRLARRCPPSQDSPQSCDDLDPLTRSWFARGGHRERVNLKLSVILPAQNAYSLPIVARRAALPNPVTMGAPPSRSWVPPRACSRVRVFGPLALPRTPRARPAGPSRSRGTRVQASTVGLGLVTRPRLFSAPKSAARWDSPAPAEPGDRRASRLPVVSPCR